MAKWEELDQHEKEAANAFVDHRNNNRAKDNYPMSVDGISRYVNDHGGELSVKLGLNVVGGAAASAVGRRYGSRVLKYLEGLARK